MERGRIELPDLNSYSHYSICLSREIVVQKPHLKGRSFAVRKVIGSAVLLTWVIAYIGVAGVVGDRVASEHWLIQLVFFPVAGLAWILPVRPLLRWMHAEDAPADRPDV